MPRQGSCWDQAVPESTADSLEMAGLWAEPGTWRLRLVGADRAHVGGLGRAWEGTGRGRLWPWPGLPELGGNRSGLHAVAELAAGPPDTLTLSPVTASPQEPPLGGHRCLPRPPVAQEKGGGGPFLPSWSHSTAGALGVSGPVSSVTLFSSQPVLCSFIRSRALAPWLAGPQRGGRRT